MISGSLRKIEFSYCSIATNSAAPPPLPLPLWWPPGAPPYDRHNPATAIWFVPSPLAAPAGTIFLLHGVLALLNAHGAVALAFGLPVCLCSVVASALFCLGQHF